MSVGIRAYTKRRRERLKAAGICTDCQRRRIRRKPRLSQRTPSLCAACRRARRVRLAAGRRQLYLPFVSEAL
jgi:hypothetical protein